MAPDGCSPPHAPRRGKTIALLAVVSVAVAMGLSGAMPGAEPAAPLPLSPSPPREWAGERAAPAPPEQGPGGPEHRYGLRMAWRVDEQTAALSFGPSFVEKIGAQSGTYRIVSATDPAYSAGLRASSVKHSSAPDAAPPPGWGGRTYLRHRVELKLPRPLKKGNRYWVQALGMNGQPVTGGRAAAWIEELDDAAAERAASENALGVRRLEILAPVVVQITVGDGFDAGRYDGHPETIILSCPDDPDFKAGAKAVRVGRRTRGDCYYTDGWPYGFYLLHELFAVFEKPLKQGNTYTLDLNASAPLTCGQAKAEVLVDDRKNINPALKVNQIGYLPSAPAKYAYLGAWLGSLEALDFWPWAKEFQVRDADSRKAVLTGAAKLRHKHGEKNETVYKEDLSGEDVYEMDLSALQQEGRYYVTLTGLGRSFEFRVANDVYVQPFRVMMNGVLHQRCGIELKAPYSIHCRPACHRNVTELTDLSRGSEQDAFQNLPEHVTGTQKLDLYGGHHDAGDYNPRSHLDVAEMAFLAYEAKPAAFADGQLSIPEAHNGIPDILDEGRWALDLWARLQDEDGGVRNGTESNGDPDQITLAEFDSKRDFAFAKDAPGSLRFAACAAQAALIWEKLGQQAESQGFLKRAGKAWDWALAKDAEKHPDMLALAAIQLYRASGENKYLESFQAHSVFKRLPNAQLDEWQKYDQRDASFYYAFCARPVDAALKQKILAAFKQKLDLWVRAAETTAYRYMRHPYAPNTWGTGGHPKWLVDAIQGYVLLKDPAYLKWIELTCDFALGCHPMNRVFTTRLGQRCISVPLHMFSRYSPDGPIAGLQCEGPNKEEGGKKASASMSSWIGAMLYPAGPWPELHTYSDVGLSPSMNEGVVADQIKTAIAYAFLLPER